MFHSDASSGQWLTWTLASVFLLPLPGGLTGAAEPGTAEQAAAERAHASGPLIEACRLEQDHRFDAALATYYGLFQISSAIGSGTEAPDSQVQATRAVAMWRAAQLHQRLRQDTEAKRLLLQLLEEESDQTDLAAIWLALGEVVQRSEGPTEAKFWFEQLRANFPQTPHAREAAYWLAVAAADENKWRPASQHASWLEQELLRQDVADTHNRRWLQLLTHTLLLRIHIAMQEGNWQEVQRIAMRLLDRNPADHTRNVAQFWLAESDFRLGREENARTRFAQLATCVIGSDKPWVPMVPLRTAQLAARHNNWTEVLALTERMAKEYPDFPLQYEVDYLQGRALAGRGEMNGARRAYRRAIDRCVAMEKEPETVPMAQWMIGETYFHQRDYPRARQAYQKVIDEHQAAAWQARAALQMGKCWELEGGWENAKTVYAEALEQWPEQMHQQELQTRLRWAHQQTEAKRR
jgi:tetratricopeptide (TPR) repeat protein